MGKFSNTNYRAGNDEVIEVDERDYEYMLSLSKHGKKYFEAFVEDEVVVADTVEEYVEETEEDVVSELLEEPYDYFEVISDITEELALKIHELDVHNFEDLHSKGKEWLQQLPGIGVAKANKIYKELEILIGEYK